MTLPRCCLSDSALGTERVISHEVYRILNADVPSDRVCCDFVQCPNRPNVFCKALDVIAPKPSHEGSTFRMARCKTSVNEVWKRLGSIGFSVPCIHWCSGVSS